MHRPKRWNIAPPHERTAELASRLRTSPLLAQVLLNRGLSDPLECTKFLRPSLGELHPPEELPNLTAAAARIARAIADKEKIVIYGDYDVDGITATSILWHAITLLDGLVDYYIPHRIDEGYGLNSEAIDQICRDGAKLIVTVDCGITALEPAAVAAQHGVDLIITDHHEWKESGHGGSDAPGASSPSLPQCHTIVHPRLLTSSAPYANPNLCGAGIAFKLAWAIGQAVHNAPKVSEPFREFLVDATAFAALGTIADVVPLIGENRILAHWGLGGLKRSRLRGLVALIESAGLTDKDLDSYDVGFRLGPRLNACGRMGHARLAVEMLTRADAARAAEIATYLESQNRQRQAMEKRILEQAIEQVETNHFADENSRGLVLGGEGWHPGVIGIVASRIVERFGRPAIMIALTNGHGQGSGRSIPGFHLTRALDACSETLESFGGHEMAAGLRLQSSRLDDFRAAFRAHAARMLTAEQIIPELQLEAVCELRHLTHALVRDFKRLAPFGSGNRRPLLCCRDVTIAAAPRRVGKSGDHLQILLRQSNATMKCIAFNYGHLFDELTVGRTVHLAVEPAINAYNGMESVQLELKDLQFA